MTHQCIVSVNLSHDASVCVFYNGEIVYYCQEERLSHIKHASSYVWRSMDYVFKNYDPSAIYIGYLEPEENIQNLLEQFKHYLSFGYRKSVDYIQAYYEHHAFHAFHAYYSSSFDDCAVLVVDGTGKYCENDLRETESICSFVEGQFNFHHQIMHKNSLHDSGISYMWELVSQHYFGNWYGAGKLMGASAYGSDNPNHPKAYVNGKGNPRFITAVQNNEISFEDASYRLQNDSFDLICELIEETVRLTGQKNICLTGGYFQNCVNNFKLVKKYSNLNFYVDPISTDVGIASGVARTVLEDTKKGFDTLYLGNQANYEYTLQENEKEYKVTSKNVAELIASKNIVALYQGKAELGHRALGNRSILYDPRDPSGRDHVNKIKKREYYRPFAGTVMLEHAREWFDMDRLDESPFMMYAVNTLKEKRDLVPALQHNDGTSRIQTLTKEQNINYYDLIKEFYNLTGVPMVLNTSFNLAGDTLVDNMQDALNTCREANIKYLYCPERSLMIEL